MKIFPKSEMDLYLRRHKNTYDCLQKHTEMQRVSQQHCVHPYQLRISELSVHEEEPKLVQPFHTGEKKLKHN